MSSAIQVALCSDAFSVLLLAPPAGQLCGLRLRVQSCAYLPTILVLSHRTIPFRVL